MKVVVGSKNPVKVESTRKAFSRFFDDVSVEGMKTKSGVSEMPMSEQEILEGAMNRAKNAMSDDVDFAVGIEGGVHDSEHGMVLVGSVVVLDKKGNMGLSKSEGFLLPDKVAKHIRNGRELGPLMDELTGNTDLKKKGGAVSIFTKDHITRTDAFESAVIYALVKFINKDWYEIE